MNFYTWHIGDFARKTRGLSMQQQGVYRAMLDDYYASERPLYGTPDQIAERIGASNDSERADVALILRRFFVRVGDEYRQNHADQVIDRYLQRAPAREQEKENARARRERHNMQRSMLFAALRSKGTTPPYHTRMQDLRDMAQRLGLSDVLQQVDVMDGSRLLEANARPDGVPTTVPTAGTTNHEPLTTNQHTERRPDAVPGPDGAARGARGVSSVSVEQNTATAVVNTAKRFGIDYANAADAKLLALLRGGCTLAEFETACAMTHAKGKGWAYMLGIVEQRRADQAREKPQEGPKSGDRAANAAWLRGLEAVIAENAKNGGSDGR